MTSRTSLLRWAVRRRAWSRWHLVRYWRYARLRLLNRDVETDGIVWLGRGVRLAAHAPGALRLGRHVHVGDGGVVVCMAGLLEIGRGTVLGFRNHIQAFESVTIGADVLTAADVFIADFDHRTDLPGVPARKQPIRTGPVVVGDGSWLGVRVVVTRGVTIGERCAVGANAVVTTDLPAACVAGGVPARILRQHPG
jgi:acetyltransferase-like isoleucine patch superfamily enzyme